MKNQLLLDWMEENKVSMSGLAKSCNVTRQMIFNYFRDDRYIPLSMIPAISKRTGIKAKDLRPDVYELFKADL